MAHSCFDKVKSWFLEKFQSIFHNAALSSMLLVTRARVASSLFKTDYIWRKLEEEDECNDSNEQQNEERDHVANIRGDHTLTRNQLKRNSEIKEDIYTYFIEEGGRRQKALLLFEQKSCRYFS